MLMLIRILKILRLHQFSVWIFYHKYIAWVYVSALSQEYHTIVVYHTFTIIGIGRVSVFNRVYLSNNVMVIAPIATDRDLKYCSLDAIV